MRHSFVSADVKNGICKENHDIKLDMKNLSTQTGTSKSRLRVQEMEKRTSSTENTTEKKNKSSKKVNVK